mgnify:FL=1
MGKKIEHEGIIESIDGSHIQVKILQSSACSSCQVKSMCATAESQEKLIDIYTPLSKDYSVGERVKACGTLTMGRNAVLLAFVLPLALIVISVLCGLYVFNLSEQLTIVSVLVALAIYYLIIHSLRSRLSKQFSFWIEKIENKY